jgi:uncharacterized protein (DUF885 family)
MTATACDAAASAAADVGALAEDYWRFRMEEFPTEATAAGDKRGADRLGDAGLGAHQRRADAAAGFLRRAGEIEAGRLDPESADTLRLLAGQAGNMVEAHRLGEHLAPSLFPFGFFDAPGYLAGATDLRTLGDRRAFLRRLADVPRNFNEHLACLEAGLQAGRRLPRPVLLRVRAMLNGYAGGGLAGTLRRRFAPAPQGASAAEAAQVQAELEAVIRDALEPALRRVLAFFEGRETALVRDSVGLCDQPDGEACYRFLVRRQTTTDLDPDAIHSIGLDEMQALRAELCEVAAAAGFASPGAFAAELAARTPPAPEELLQAARALTRRIDAQLPPLFGALPRVTYGVELMSAEQSRELPPAMAQPAPADRALPGVMWLTALPERCPAHILTALCLHEAWPGHLMQFALAHERADLPAFRRYGWTDYNGYVEGWALYCERLGVELGLYETPELAFGRLVFESLRTMRLVVDTGLHAKGWTREQAIAFMAQDNLHPPATIESEVDRYIGMPAQALSYKLGERTIRGLRREAEAILGQGLDLRQFHDQVLSAGPMALDCLEARIRRWLQTDPGRSRRAVGS